MCGGSGGRSRGVRIRGSQKSNSLATTESQDVERCFLKTDQKAFICSAKLVSLQTSGSQPVGHDPPKGQKPV